MLTYRRRASQAFRFRKFTAKPFTPKLWRDDSFPLRQTNVVDYWWLPYPVLLQAQISMRVDIREVDYHLTVIAEDVLDYLYPLPDGPSGPPITNPARCIRLYNALVQWRLSLPPRLRLEESVSRTLSCYSMYSIVNLSTTQLM